MRDTCDDGNVEYFDLVNIDVSILVLIFHYILLLLLILLYYYFTKSESGEKCLQDSFQSLL